MVGNLVVPAPGRPPAGSGRLIHTARGPLILRAQTPPDLLAALAPDPGLGAFWRYRPTGLARQQEALVRIAGQATGRVATAATVEGNLVGYVTFHPPDPDPRWTAAPVLELGGIEVARRWRARGVARELLQEAMGHPSVEEQILITLCLAWHWDLEGTGLDKYRYRDLLARLFATAGFEQVFTDEGNIACDGANALLARRGARIAVSTWWGFLGGLVQNPDSLYAAF